jgi:hypothetical protein
MLGVGRLIPDAVGNGSSTVVLVKSGSIVYSPIAIATTAMMMNITMVFFFIFFKTSCTY